MYADKQPVWIPVLAILGIATLAISISFWLLYQSAYQRQLQGLQSRADTLASFLEAVAEHDLKDGNYRSREDARQATLEQIRHGLNLLPYQQGNAELVIGQREGDVIKFLSKSGQNQHVPKDVPFDGRLAQPMYLALQGKSGNGELLNYAGVKVLAGYAPVPSLGIGIVLHIPHQDFIAPFIRAANLAAAIMMLMIVLFITGFMLYRNRISGQLEDSKKRLAEIVELMPSMIFMKRADDLSFVLLNKAGEKLTGLKREQLLGKTDHDFFPKDQADFFTSRDRQVLDTSGFEDIKEECINTPQGTRILHTQKFAIKDSNGNPEYLLGVSEDITELKQYNDTLLHTNQLLSATFDYAPVMLAYLDTNMNFVRVNQAYAAADKKSPEFYVGKNHFELFPNAENEALFRRVAERGAAYTAKAKPFEFEHNPEHGVSHWDWTLTPIKNDHNNVTGLVLSLVNVTERIESLESIQRSEVLLKNINEILESRVRVRTSELQSQIQRNELILETTHDGFCATDSTGRIRSVNKAMCDTLGYSFEELIQLSIPDIEANENPDEVARHIAHIMQYGHDRFDTCHRKKDGSLIDVEVSVCLAMINNEKMFYAFVRDITERKQTETALRTARNEAEQANHAKSEFLSRMSHELRTPMNAILGFAQVLQLENLASTQNNYVQEIQDAGNHLLSLINELLDLSRIEAGKLAAAIQSVDVKSVVAQAIHLVESQTSEKQLTLINECKDDMLMLADPMRLRQILVNLLSNSAKYNCDNGFIYVDCQKEANNMLRLTVTDTGIGINPENINKLFHPFERLGAENSGIDGTGIGLALSIQLAKLMGGTMGVESTPGKGSTFWLELPLATTTGNPEQTESFKGIDTLPANKNVVLYIEDNAANLKVVEAVFQHHPDLRLISATNGRYGLELARHYQPAAILLDIHLPDISGYTVLTELRSNNTTRNIPVIALSADAMPLDIERGREAGFDDYLTKPVKLDLLMNTLEKALAA